MVVYQNRSLVAVSKPYRIGFYGVLAIIGAEVISGAIMYYFEVPPVMQPIHLLLANLMFGVQFYLFTLMFHLKLFPAKQKVSSTVGNAELVS